MEAAGTKWIFYPLSLALMLGITFKENCLPTVAFAKEGPDIRNTKAIDIYHELREYDVEVDVYDPCLPRIFGGPIRLM